MADEWAARFDKFHAPAGSATGGQFASASGSGSKGTKGKTPAKGAAHPAASGHGGSLGKQALLQEAHRDTQQAKALEIELDTLQKQEHAAVANAKHQATAAASAKKSGHVVKHQAHAATAKHHHAHARTLKERITALKTKIRGLRAHAASLEKQAHAMRAAGLDTDPAATERLHEYWVHGKGAAKIAWGAPGDFDRCVTELGKYIRDPQGYCNLAHHAALGIYPATHAADIRKASGRAAMADAKPYGDVKYADPKNGKYPIDTAAHAKAAWAYVNMPKNAAQYPLNGVTVSEVKDRIMAACKHFGIDIAGDDSDSEGSGDSGRAESLAPYVRSFPLEDISVRSGSDGRTVEAYAAVFGVSAPVRDQDGQYTEELDPACFNRAIANAAPQGSRRNWKIGVFYNHGMTISGAPSDRHSMPVGKILDIKADNRGLWTEVRYNRTQLADEVLENIREGSIPGYSFQGHFRRSTPLIPRGGFRKDYRSGELPHVRRLESTLLELGPTPMPVYEDAAVMGMRADQLLGAMAADPELAMRMISMFSPSTHDDDSLADTGIPDTGLATGDSPRQRRSGRSIREQIMANTALLLQQQHRR